MSVVPPTFKSFTSAVKRAEELERDPSREKRVLAYYCRMYVVSKGAKLATAAPEDRKFLEEQLIKLESMKPSLSLAGDEGPRICREQALEVFNKADEVDRMGLADKSTVKLFYSAGTFFEILEQFGPLDSEIAERKKYAKWKAADIMNALNNGEIPTPGGFGEAPPAAAAAPSSAGAPPVSSPVPPAPVYPAPSPAPAPASYPPTTYGAPPASTAAPSGYDIPSAPSFSVFGQAAAAAVSTAANQVMSALTPSTHHYPPAGPNLGASRAPPINNADPRVKDTVELCNFAIAALKHNEIALARDRLQEALKRLG